MAQKKRNPFIAALLTLITLGMGQVYNGQAQKGILYFSLYWGILLLSGWSHRFNSFKGMLITVALCVALFVMALLDAIIVARKVKEIPLKSYNQWYIYLLPAVLWMGISIPVKQLRFGNFGKFITGLEAYRMPGKSMEPTLLSDEHFFVDLNHYGKSSPERRDVVAFPYPAHPDLEYLKRIVAIGGDTIEIKNGDLYINHQIFAEPYLNKEGKASDQIDFGPVTVPSGKVFVLGDNRPASSDSRAWGFVDAPSISGKALYVWWSSDRGRIGKQIQ